jgi:hypothetical protein
VTINVKPIVWYDNPMVVVKLYFGFLPLSYK